MKNLILITMLCLLATVSQATFEIQDPTQVDEDAKTSKPISFLNKDSKAGVTKVIVPMGVELIQPTVESNKCIGLAADHSEIKADGTSGSLTVETYMGVVVSTTDCKLTGSDDESDLNISLIETTQGRLIWVDSSRLLKAR